MLQLKNNNAMKEMNRVIYTPKITEKMPIITSLLDTDMYKFTMGQFVFDRYPDVPVKYSFNNRTNIKLAEIINEKDLRRELDAIQDLKATEQEIAYLRTLKNNGKQLFKEPYLEFLKNPNIGGYELEVRNREFHLEFPGNWKNKIFYETPALAIMNELHYRELTKNFTKEQLKQLHKTGEQRLEEKIQILEQNPNVKFVEFGTRRRFAKIWQDYITKTLKEKTPAQIIGTSNVYLAMKYGLEPKGTMAHELFMIMSGIMHKNDDEIRASHNQVLKEWWNEYGPGLSIALTDTYGSDFFFNDMAEKQAKDWKGMRQDSGIPQIFGERQIKFYEEKNIDPKQKLFFPSDGLDLAKMIKLHNQFSPRIATASGWGTNLTNDLGLKPLSIVIKATESCGNGTVKLSDNPAKATGKPEDIARFKKIFEYNDNKYKYEGCKY